MGEISTTDHGLIEVHNNFVLVADFTEHNKYTKQLRDLLKINTC
jgi:hypothetical protein